MPKRVVGECRPHHFQEVEHLIMQLKDGETIDMETLTPSQRVAIAVMVTMWEQGSDLSQIKNYARVLEYEHTDGHHRFEIMLKKGITR